MKESDTPTLVDSMGRDLFAGDVVLIPGIPVKWIIDSVELGSQPGVPPAVRITAHATLVSVFPADQPIPNITRAATKDEKAELDEHLEAARMRAAPSIVRPH